MTSPAPPITAAAKQQHQNDDDEDQFHKSLLGYHNLKEGSARHELSSALCEKGAPEEEHTNMKCEALGPISPAVRQRARLRGVVSQEPKMSNGRPNLLFFGLIAASLCAAAVLIGLLVADEVADPRVAMNHSLQAGSRQ